MHGKEYMAPCTGLQRMPGASLKTCSVSLALAASSANTACLSCGPKARQAGAGRGSHALSHSSSAHRPSRPSTLPPDYRLELREGGVRGLGRADRHVEQDLAGQRWAQPHTHQLLHLLLHRGVHVHHLHVAAAEPAPVDKGGRRGRAGRGGQPGSASTRPPGPHALAHVALGDRVEGG